MEEIINIIQSETFASILTVGFSGFGGYLLNEFHGKWKNKIQIMKCYYIEDDILSKIP